MKFTSCIILIALLSLSIWTTGTCSAGPSKRATTVERQPEESNEIDDRIIIAEPYKSMLETTAKFALAQTKVTKIVSLDTAVQVLSDVTSIILKPAVLFKLARVLASIFAVVFTTAFFFPSTYNLMEHVWKDPAESLNLDRLADEGSVIGLLGARTDEVLTRLGLKDNRCREQSICHIGEMLRCSFPQTSETLIKFSQKNLSTAAIKEHPYAKAFSLGFVEQNCARLFDGCRDSPSCLTNFVSSVLLSPRSANKNRT